MNEPLTGTNYRSVLKRLLLVAGCITLPVIAWAQWTTSSNDIYNSNSGKVGIGTTSPSSLFTVQTASGRTVATSDANSRPTLTFTNASTVGYIDLISSGRLALVNQSAQSLVLGTNNVDRMTIDSSGNVGIGTSTPSAKLNLVGGGLRIEDRGDTCCADVRLADNGYETHLYSYGNGNFQIHKYGTGSLAGPAFTILNTGKVGIGTTSPSTALEVSGDVTVSGNISAKYQDIAEWVSTKQVLPAGTVVALDTESDNGIVPSSVPYDTHVAGVVSDSPGIILGQSGPGKLKIATTGRVKVRVDTSNGPIRRGDLLVTGTKEGTAMRSEAIDVGGAKFHRPGTLIGKALEPLETGEGEILVLLSLQ